MERSLAGVTGRTPAAASSPWLDHHLNLLEIACSLIPLHESGRRHPQAGWQQEGTGAYFGHEAVRFQSARRAVDANALMTNSSQLVDGGRRSISRACSTENESERWRGGNSRKLWRCWPTSFCAGSR